MCTSEYRNLGIMSREFLYLYLDVWEWGKMWEKREGAHLDEESLLWTMRMLFEG